MTAGHLTGPYRIDHAAISVTALVTNKTPSGAFRGYGVPEAVFALERFVEKAARVVGVDPLDARRRMLLDHGDLPYTTAGGGIVDSGSFHEAFEHVVSLGQAALSEARQAARTDDRIRVGLGIATYREGTAPTHFTVSGLWGGQESCAMRLESDGTVVVSSGLTDQGQGTTTMVATLAADALGLPIGDVRVVLGDSDLCPYGLGAFGSRSAVVGGGAILLAAERVREKILQVAAQMLEANPADLVVRAGRVSVRGSGHRSITVADVGLALNVRTTDLPPDIEPGLQVLANYEPPMLEHVVDGQGRINAAAAWANSTHAAVVKVDLDTGSIKILSYVIAHDCGPLINPIIVEGQIQGGVAHGIGGTIYEHLAYSPEGQPMATSFMDYLIPSASEVPSMVVDHFESPSPNLPLGVKGVGEGGTVGPPAAIANAVTDALAEFGVDVTSTPLDPQAIRRLLRSGGS